MTASGKTEQRTARGKRLSAALRENLKRRKRQARGRAGTRAAHADAPATAQSGDVAPDFRRNPGSD